MRRFMVYCDDIQSRDDARKFFRKMFEGNIIVDNASKLETRSGILIVFASHKADVCGHKLDDFIVLNNKHEHSMYENMFICTLG